MAAISITAANVSKNTGTTRQHNTGVAITAGQTLYLTASGVWGLCDADAAGTADCHGVALHGAASGQPLTALTAGTLDLGATLTVGAPYFVHTTAGGIGVLTELASGDYVTYLGTALAADNFELQIHNTGAVEA